MLSCTCTICHNLMMVILGSKAYQNLSPQVETLSKPLNDRLQTTMYASTLQNVSDHRACQTAHTLDQCGLGIGDLIGTRCTAKLQNGLDGLIDARRADR